MTNELLVYIFENNHRVFHLNTEGITHAESLKTYETGSSCMNWIVGHITVTRDRALDLLGKAKLQTEEMTEKYKRGSPNITADIALPFDTLSSLYDQSQEKLCEAIRSYDFSIDPELAKRIQFFGFHEAYHCGQLGLLRRIVGKEGAIK